MSKLCLGTVQFGMKYGINNLYGQPTVEECFEMLDMALENGIDVIDTASAYGTAEDVLGNYFQYRHCQSKVNVITKLKPNIIASDEKDIYSVVRREVETSLQRLHLSHLKGYLFHTPEYIWNDEMVYALFRLKEEGIVENIGVSIYEMKDGFKAIEQGVDYVQLPYSVLDQRGYHTGFLKKAKEVGITIFTRSAFLQGLFMMEQERIPDNLSCAVVLLDYFDKLINEKKIGKVEALLQFVKSEPEIDYIVFGVDNAKQLLENICSFDKDATLDSKIISEVKKNFAKVDNSIILPSLWANGKKVN